MWMQKVQEEIDIDTDNWIINEKHNSRMLL